MRGYIIGQVSSIDAAAGMVKVTYPRHEDIISEWLPLLASEYNMPAVGEYVATLLDEDHEGVCFGKVFSYSQPPTVSEGYKKTFDGVTVEKQNGVFKIDFGDGAFIKYANGTMTLKASSIILDGYDPTIKCRYNN